MKFVTLFCVSVFLLATSTVYADPAVVIDEFGCAAYVPDSAPLVLLTTNESHKVITSKDTRIITCHFNHELELTHAISDRGFVCGIKNEEGEDLLLTEDSMMLVAPGGRATLVCKVQGNG